MYVVLEYKMNVARDMCIAYSLKTDLYDQILLDMGELKTKMDK